MFCPKCKSEYREGFKVCIDCGLDLVEALPNNEIEDLDYEYKELVTIRTTNNQMIIALVKSILDSAEIKYFIKGGLSYRNIDPMEIQVFEEDAIYAKDLIKELDMQ